MSQIVIGIAIRIVALIETSDSIIMKLDDNERLAETVVVQSSVMSHR